VRAWSVSACVARTPVVPVLFRARLVLVLLFLFSALPARGAIDDEDGLSYRTSTSDEAALTAPRTPKTSDVASNGAFLPFGQPARVSSLGYALSSGGYDGVRRTGLFETNLEARIVGNLALRLGTAYSGEPNRMRPSVGIRLGVLDAGRDGLDLSAGVLDRPEGFTETEGEIEGAVAIGARFHSVLILGNIVYGQDPEGRERDGELRVAIVHRFGSRLLGGFDSRARLNLAAGGSGPHGEPHLDVVAGPAVTVIVGPIGLILNGGGSLVQMDNVSLTRYGLYIMGGLGLGL